MNVQIDFSPQYEAQLITAARRKGVDVSTYVKQVVQETLPPIEPTPAPMFSPPTSKASVRLRERLANESTNNPKEIQKAEAELAELKSIMNRERQRAGAEPIF